MFRPSGCDSASAIPMFLHFGREPRIGCVHTRRRLKRLLIREYQREPQSVLISPRPESGSSKLVTLRRLRDEWNRVSLKGLLQNALLLIDSAPIIYLLEDHLELATAFRPVFEAHDEGLAGLAVTMVTLAGVLTGPLSARGEVLAERYRATFKSWFVVALERRLQRAQPGGASRSEDLRLDTIGKAPALQASLGETQSLVRQYSGQMCRPRSGHTCPRSHASSLAQGAGKRCSVSFL